MKTFLTSIFLLSFIIYNISGFGNVISDELSGNPTTQSATNTLQVLSSAELFDLTSNWVAGFNKLHPELEITTGLMGDNTSLEPGSIYLLTSNQQAILPSETTWQMPIAHDLIVPILNSQNPHLGKIYKKGFSAEDFATILSGNANWSSLVDGAPNKPVHTFILDRPQFVSKIAGYSNIDEAAVGGQKVNSSLEVISAIQNDPYAVGFCKLVDVLQSGTNAFADQISILPVDKNRNGRLDSFENIYSNPDQLTRGAWLGKYPKALCGNMYALAASEPSDQAALDFLAWVNKDGQKYLTSSGYSVLSSREKTANLLVLVKPIPTSDPAASPLIPMGWKLFIGAIILLSLIVLIRSKRKKQLGLQSEDIATTPALNENSILAPAGLYYDKSHTWAYREPDGMVIIGIDDFMQHLTGSLTQVKMKEPGEKVRKGEKVLTLVREGKQLELCAPVSGTIKLQNQRLKAQPAGINSAPYTDGWVYLLEPANWHREIRFLMVVEKYREWLEDEFTRLKDFLANSANANERVFNQLVLQDGGELTDQVLANLSPEVWEDFQTQFIDKAR